jgi:hypothetical protein
MFDLSKRTRKHYDEFMVPLAKTESWATKYNLDSESAECPFCSQYLVPMLPFATKNSRGIMFESCDCNEAPPGTSTFIYRAVDNNDNVFENEAVYIQYGIIGEGMG